jgi:hypothetical protein
VRLLNTPATLGNLGGWNCFENSLPMNTENRILTLDPELVADVRSQVEEWNEELLNPWKPSHAAKGVVQIIRNSCPRMADALEAAGIFEPWAEMLHDQVLDLAIANRLAGMAPSEAESEARKDLIPWCWEMQEEWLEACCLDYAPEPDPDLYGPDDPRHSQYEEPEEEDDDGIPLLRFEPGQSRLIQDKLAAAVKSALKNRELSSPQMMKLGAFLWLVERLPEHHEKYTGQIELSCDHGEDGAGWTKVTISGDGLALDKGEIVRGEYGSDHPSKTVFRVSSTSASDYDLDFDLEEWLRDFVGDAGDTDVEFSVEWYPENEMPPSGEIHHAPVPTYQASSVAWAIACLGFPDGPDISPDGWEIGELVDSEKFGKWLKDKIEDPPDYAPPEFQPDSMQASEAASASAEEAWQATMTMETLTKKQQQSLQAQVDAEDLPSDISHEVSMLMPYGSRDDRNEEEDDSNDLAMEESGELWCMPPELSADDEITFGERVRQLSEFHESRRENRKEALDSFEFENLSSISDDLDDIRDKQIRILTDEIRKLNAHANGIQGLSFMPDHIRLLLDQKCEAFSALEFETAAKIDEAILGYFAQTIAGLAGDIAMLREEVRILNRPEH